MTKLSGAAALLSLCILASCSNSMKEINDVTGSGQMQDDRGIDVTVLYSKNGKVQARLFTHELISNDGATPPYVDMRNGMKVEFFNDSVKVKNTLTARYARWYKREGDILIRDSVVVVDDQGKRLETDELVWNQSNRKFITEKPVRITTPTQILFGDGMVADQDFSHYQITRPRGAVRVNKGEVPGS